MTCIHTTNISAYWEICIFYGKVVCTPKNPATIILTQNLTLELYCISSHVYLEFILCNELSMIIWIGPPLKSRDYYHTNMIMT